MNKYVVYGGKRLEGELHISGSKNAVLPIIAATVLNGDVTVLYNCPKILDVEIMLEILKQLGCCVKWENSTLIIDTSTIDSYDVSEELVRKMRSSIILLGAIIGRLKQGRISYPGGCPLGARPIDLHLAAFKKMGIIVNENHGFIECSTSNLQGARIHLDFPSVGATENIMLAAVLAKGDTIIYNAAREPEILDLQNYLNSTGALVMGAGTDTIYIRGVKSLHQTQYTVISDRIITGTYLVAAAITRGHVVLRQTDPQHLAAVISKLRGIGCHITEGRDYIILDAPQTLSGTDINTQPYPGFPTDMQAQMMTLLCTCQDTSIVVENLFEARYKHAEELIRMGANINIRDRVCVIKPVKMLTGCHVYAADLRGGAALVLAGLVAEGETTINQIVHIQRGYENIVSDLSILGANIEEKE